MTTQSVQVKIELGHKASVRKKRTQDGFTHDWTVFVRGPEGCNIQHFVEKVVMHLHDSFPRPKRVLKEPPYQVSESGYAGFNLPVEIYFKSKEEPRKILFKYDLFLHNEGCPPVNHVRCEKLTFQNPTEEFRRKLLRAGGVGVPGPNDHAQYKPTSATVTPTATAVTQPAAPVVPPTAEGKAFTDLFGAPLYKQDARKKNKSKDKSGKGKNGSSPTETPSPNSAPSSQGKPASSSSLSKEKTDKSEKSDKTSSSRSNASVSSASSYKSKTSGAGVIPSKEKTALKRPAESSPSSSDGAKKKRSKEDDKEKEHSRGKKHKSSHSHRKSHSSSSSKSEKKRCSDINGESISKPPPPSKPTPLSSSQQSSGDVSKSKKQTVIDLSDGELSSSDSDDDDDVVVTEVEASPASSGNNNKNSFMNGGGGPLGKLWDEIEQGEDMVEMLSPLPKSSPPTFFSQSPSLPASPEKPKSRTNGTSDVRLNKVSPSDITNHPAPNGETFAMLLELQRRLLSVTDKELLHKIVKIIQDTQQYQISDSTFDFDLCSLDSKTVGKLQNFLNLQA